MLTIESQYRLTLDLVTQAIHCIKGKIRRTPIEFSSALSDLLDAPVYLKLEAMQITGSFKVRGALFYLSTLSEEVKRNGIAACSAGNHGLGIAYAAKMERIPCTVYVPRSVDLAKLDKIQKLGATVNRSEFDGYDETLVWAENEVQKTGRHLISAFEDERIMAGNGGTLAAEILEDIPDIQNLIFPVGGGGLAAGLAYYFKEKKPFVRLIGCQHINSAALKLSLDSGIAVTSLPAIETLAGGIEGGIGRKCFEIVKNRINQVALVTEEEILEGFRWVLEHHQQLIEPTAIVPLACCLAQKISKLEGKTVIVLSGRNVAYPTIKGLLKK